MNQIEDKTPEESELQKIGKVLWTYRWRLGFALIVLVLLPFLLSSFLQFIFGERSWRILDPNEIGDTFGFLNSIMSSIAAIGVVVAIYLQQKQLIDQRKQLELQREDLTLQRQEMKDSREELRKSAEAQKELVEMQLLQTYLSTSSSLLKHQSNIHHDKFTKLVEETENLLERIKPRISKVIISQPIDLSDIVLYVSRQVAEMIICCNQRDEGLLRKITFSLTDKLKWYKFNTECDHAESFVNISAELYQIIAPIAYLRNQRIDFQSARVGLESVLNKLTQWTENFFDVKTEP